MNRAKQIREDLDGSVLIVTLCLLFIVAGLVITILDVASDHRAISVRQVNLDQAMYVAEAGAEVGARFMESNLTVMVNSSTGKTNGSGSVGSGTYNYFIYRTNTSTYCIISTGTVSGVSNGSGSNHPISRVVSLMDVYQPTYAEFALWSSNNNAISFATGDVFYGPVYSGTELYFTGDPAFYSTLASDYGTYSGSISGAYLADGLALNSYQGTMADVNFNSGTLSLKSIASSSGLEVSGTATLTFNGGTVTVKTSSATQTYTIPASGGLIYVANSGSGWSSSPGTIYLEGGTVTGPLTVASEASMYIENNITYTHNPVTTPTSTDALGLISQDNIWVGTSAPAALTIDAAMIAAGTSGDGSAGSFGVINYATMIPTGTLTVYGGIVQTTRGAVGTANMSGGVGTGYAKNYNFDSRFLTKPPPDYPVISGKVNFGEWQESGN
jgi:Tfp pilus assembly protein PilX